MYYKLKLSKNGKYLDVVDMVEEKVIDDDYIYATEEEFNKLNKKIVHNSMNTFKDIC